MVSVLRDDRLLATLLPEENLRRVVCILSGHFTGLERPGSYHDRRGAGQYKGPNLLAWQREVKRAVRLKGTYLHKQVESSPLPAGVAVSATLKVVLPRPKHHYLKSGVHLSAAGKRSPYPTGRPDVDNIGKATLDALTGVLVEDDSQFVKVQYEKAWQDRQRAFGVLIVLTVCVLDPVQLQQDDRRAADENPRV